MSHATIGSMAMDNSHASSNRKRNELSALKAQTVTSRMIAAATMAPVSRLVPDCPMVSHSGRRSFSPGWREDIRSICVCSVGWLTSPLYAAPPPPTRLRPAQAHPCPAYAAA